MLRSFRPRLVVLATAGLLAVPLVVSPAGAQSSTQSTIATSAAVTYAPPGVSGVKVTVTCANLADAAMTPNAGPSATTSATFPLTGGTANIVFPLRGINLGTSPVEAGSNCSAKVSLVYPTGLGLGGNPFGSTPQTAYNAKVTIAWGGTAVATAQPLVDSSYTQPTPTAVTASTTLAIGVAFPAGIKVTKQVVGTDPSPGRTYTIGVFCADGPATPNPGGYLDIAGGVDFLNSDYHRVAFALTSGLYDPAMLYVSLKAGESYWVTGRDIAGFKDATYCYAQEVDAFGATLTYSSTTATPGTNLPGTVSPVWPFEVDSDSTSPSFGYLRLCGFVTFAAVSAPCTAYRSEWTAPGQTITVTNAFTGTLIVSKVVTGDPKSNIATYEINVNCNNGGPRETFLLKDRQSRRFDNIPVGSSCLVQETRTDGAQSVSFVDNSGDNATDGRVVITRERVAPAAPAPTRTLTAFASQVTDGCSQLGSTAATGTYTSCAAIVTVTNDYNAPATTAAVTTAAPAATAPATTAAPAVTAAPATAVEETPEYTG